MADPALAGVSVIIPTYNEAAGIRALVTALRGEAELAEVIVADGGSSDGTVTIAREAGALVIVTERGRGRQLRAGAALARGDVLLLLHADSMFPASGLRAVIAALNARPRIVGGNFRLIFDGGSRFARGLTRFYAFLRFFKLYYGDSGIFARREVYERLGGIKPIALMEDYEFVRRLERAGLTCRIKDPALVTSSRKFADRRATAIVTDWIVIHLLYWLGISPTRLAELYYRPPSRRG